MISASEWSFSLVITAAGGGFFEIILIELV
jgi:hypothetical protein